jgi:putative endonuclease
VYILQSLKDEKTYVGYTYELKQRMQKHNSGQVKSTKNRRPLKLIFTEKFLTEQEAKRRELYWKSGAGRRKLKEYFDKLK